MSVNDLTCQEICNFCDIADIASLDSILSQIQGLSPEERDKVLKTLNNFPSSQFSPAHIACFNDNDSLLYLLSKIGLTLNAPTKQNIQHPRYGLIPKGSTPVHIAARVNAVACVQLLLDLPLALDINSKDANSHTPLFLAAAYDSVATLQVISSHPKQKLDISISTERTTDTSFDSQRIWPKGSNAVIAAATHSALGLALLLKEFADCHATDDNGWSALHHACQHGNIRAVELLLEAGADKEARSSKLTPQTAKGATPLHICVRYIPLATASAASAATPTTASQPLPPRNRHLQCLLMLLKAGCNVNSQDSRGFTPLHCLAMQKDAGATVLILEYLFKHNIDLQLHLGTVVKVQVQQHGTTLEVSPGTTVYRLARARQAYDCCEALLRYQRWVKYKREMVSGNAGSGGVGVGRVDSSGIVKSTSDVALSAVAPKNGATTTGKADPFERYVQTKLDTETALISELSRLKALLQLVSSHGVSVLENNEEDSGQFHDKSEAPEDLGGYLSGIDESMMSIDEIISVYASIVPISTNSSSNNTNAIPNSNSSSSHIISLISPRLMTPLSHTPMDTRSGAATPSRHCGGLANTGADADAPNAAAAAAAGAGAGAGAPVSASGGAAAGVSVGMGVLSSPAAKGPSSRAKGAQTHAPTPASTAASSSADAGQGHAGVHIEAEAAAGAASADVSQQEHKQSSDDADSPLPAATSASASASTPAPPIPASSSTPSTAYIPETPPKSGLARALHALNTPATPTMTPTHLPSLLATPQAIPQGRGSGGDVSGSYVNGGGVAGAGNDEIFVSSVANSQQWQPALNPGTPNSFRGCSSLIASGNTAAGAGAGAGAGSIGGGGLFNSMMVGSVPVGSVGVGSVGNGVSIGSLGDDHSLQVQVRALTRKLHDMKKEKKHLQSQYENKLQVSTEALKKLDQDKLELQKKLSELEKQSESLVSTTNTAQQDDYDAQIADLQRSRDKDRERWHRERRAAGEQLELERGKVALRDDMIKRLERRVLEQQQQVDAVKLELERANMDKNTDGRKNKQAGGKPGLLDDDIAGDLESGNGSVGKTHKQRRNGASEGLQSPLLSVNGEGQEQGAGGDGKKTGKGCCCVVM